MGMPPNMPMPGKPSPQSAAKPGVGLKRQHFHIQAELPLVQHLDGPQLQRRWLVRLGWQVEF